MNERILTEMLLKDPVNDVLASMLTDELMESRPMERHAANVAVEIIRVRGIQERQQRDAAALLQHGQPYRQRLHNIIRNYCPELMGDEMTLVVDIGNAPPKAKANPDRTSRPYWRYWTVTVGAVWMLERWEIMRKADDDLKRRVRSKRDRGCK